MGLFYNAPEPTRGDTHPEEADVEGDAVHGDGDVGREDVAHAGAVGRVELVGQLVDRDVPLSLAQHVHAPEDEARDEPQPEPGDVEVGEMVEQGEQVHEHVVVGLHYVPESAAAHLSE